MAPALLWLAIVTLFASLTCNVYAAPAEVAQVADRQAVGRMRRDWTFSALTISAFLSRTLAERQSLCATCGPAHAMPRPDNSCSSVVSSSSFRLIVSETLAQGQILHRRPRKREICTPIPIPAPTDQADDYSFSLSLHYRILRRTRRSRGILFELVVSWQVLL